MSAPQGGAPARWRTAHPNRIVGGGESLPGRQQGSRCRAVGKCAMHRLVLRGWEARVWQELKSGACIGELWC